MGASALVNHISAGTDPGAPYLIADGVTRRYGAGAEAVEALRGVSFTLARGQFAALAGRSGCGKTTLLNLCGAMDFPSSGAVRIGGVCTTGLPDTALTRLRRSQIGFIFQFFQLLPTLTAIENVELPALLSGVADPRPRALELLGFVEMEKLGHRLPHQLSGGQMQRVAIARALINNPGLILADEPIGNLDSTTGALVLNLLRRAALEHGAVVLMATHSLESTIQCHQVMRLRDGLIEETITR